MRQLAGTRTRYRRAHAAPLAGLISGRAKYNGVAERGSIIVPGNSPACGLRPTILTNLKNIRKTSGRSQRRFHIYLCRQLKLCKSRFSSRACHRSGFRFGLGLHLNSEIPRRPLESGEFPMLLNLQSLLSSGRPNRRRMSRQMAIARQTGTVQIESLETRILLAADWGAAYHGRNTPLGGLRRFGGQRYSFGQCRR
jgi:hypothetical protein